MNDQLNDGWNDAAYDPFEDEDTLEFVITSADEEDESTWQWDGHDWKRVV